MLNLRGVRVTKAAPSVLRWTRKRHSRYERMGQAVGWVCSGGGLLRGVVLLSLHTK